MKPLEMDIQGARVLLVVSVAILSSLRCPYLSLIQNIQRQMRLFEGQNGDSKQTNDDCADWKSIGDFSINQDPVRIQLKPRTDVDTLSHNTTSNSIRADFNINNRGRIVQLTQIINTGSGTVSGCSLSSTANEDFQSFA